MSNNYVEGSSIIIVADGKVFSKEVVLKTLYWYGDNFHTEVQTEENCFRIIMRLTSTSKIDRLDLDIYLQKFERDLIDFSLRESINLQTKNIRELLLAKAFSHGEFDELPPGDVSDPVGFRPLTLT